jgi:hypothetical protein
MAVLGRDVLGLAMPVRELGRHRTHLRGAIATAARIALRFELDLLPLVKRFEAVVFDARGVKEDFLASIVADEAEAPSPDYPSDRTGGGHRCSPLDLRRAVGVGHTSDQLFPWQ